MLIISLSIFFANLILNMLEETSEILLKDSDYANYYSQLLQ